MSDEVVTVEAIFEDGVFRPLQAVSLMPHQRVVLTVRVQPDALAWPADAAALYQAMAEDEHRLHSNAS
jgi:predicted DNA-binding antitoxin AbrB/MazE fold protein